MLNDKQTPFHSTNICGCIILIKGLVWAVFFRQKPTTAIAVRRRWYKYLSLNDLLCCIWCVMWQSSWMHSRDIPLCWYLNSSWEPTSMSFASLPSRPSLIQMSIMVSHMLTLITLSKRVRQNEGYHGLY